jgi:hypothetical protein
VKYKKKKKFSPKLLVWMAMPSKGTSDIYIHKSKLATTSDIYLNECINRRLLPFIDAHHKNNDFVFWPGEATAHIGGVVLNRLEEKSIPIVPKKSNPLNVSQARPIETVWSNLE